MNKRPVTSQNYRSSEKDLKISTQKLPNLSEVMNMRIKQSQELQENYQNLVRQAQNLQQQCVQKDKQISQYEFMIKSLQIAIEKRDCIIAALRQQQQQQMADMQIIKAPKTEESSRMSKRIARVRTKETNFDETLQNILENDYGSMPRYMDQYRALSHLRMIQELVENEEAFVQKVQKLDYGGIVNIFDAINLLLNEHKMLFKNNIKINKLFEQSLILGDNIPLNEQLDTFTEILKDSLDCHKSQIFILDNENQELWCQTKEKQIRISVNEDIVGACFQEKNLINVHNAYNDTRFKKENDRGYKTQTILLTPILDKQMNPIGVLEAINKMQGHFSQDDQLQIQKISELVSILLSTQQQSNESISIQNSLRNIIQAYLHVAYLENVDEILLNAEYYLKNLFHTQKGYVYLVNNSRYIRAISKGQIEEYPKGIGIIGQTEKSKELIWVQNAYNHQNFNSLVDINTTMPIYSKLVVGKKYQIIIQVINNKGIRAQKMSSFDQELLELFGNEFVSLVLKGEVIQSHVTKLQQFVFSEKIKRKQDLKEYYIKTLQKYSEELAQKQLLIQDNVEFQQAYKDSLIKLSQLGFFLAAFFPTNIFPEGFATIRELFIEKFPILQDREVLQIVRASGFDDLRIRYNFRSLIFQSSQISNEYFDKRFVNQYIKKVIDSKPQQDDQIHDYVQKSNQEIDFLFPDMKESIQLQIHKIIANYLYEKIDFNNIAQVQITQQVYDLISAQFNPQYKYGLKQKLGIEFNPYLQLAGKYKEFLQKFKINNFKELEIFNSQQKEFLAQYFTNSKYLQIQLLEFIESKLQLRINISYIFESAQSLDFFKCSINLFQEYCKYGYQKILENLGNQSCLKIKNKLEDLKSLVSDRILIKQVNELIEIINNGQLYIKKPVYTNIRVEEITNIPNELKNFIENVEQNNQKRATITKYGYADIIWLNKYEIKVSTKQLLVLIALQNENNFERIRVDRICQGWKNKLKFYSKSKKLFEIILMTHKLNLFDPGEYSKYKALISKIPGNLFINLKLENNVVGFKSSTLKQWVLSEYSVGLEFDFLNFLLNYLESFNKKDNSYHFKYQLAYFEMTPKLQNNKQYINGVSDGYIYRNLKTNYKQVKLLDQLIVVTTYRQMYFLYIIWISKQKCFIFDPQIKPQTRIFDHEIVAKQLAEQFGFYFQPECVLLKEAKQDTKTIYRVGMIMEFLFKYIDQSNDVQKIEQIKVGVSTSHKLLDSIVWFVYKCYEQDIYLTEPNKQLEKYSDKIINYQEWQQEQEYQKYNYENEREKRQQNQLQQGRNDISTNFVWDENQKSQSFFKKIANSALQSETQTSYLVDNNPKLKQSRAILINAQGFIDQKEYEQLPRHKNYEIDKSKESSRMSLSKTQFQEMMDDMRQQIKSDVMREMMFQQEQWLEDQEMKLRSKKDELNEAIAEEYMQQVRFQRYKEYMEYLLQYYYDNDPQEYDNLLSAYHQKLKEIALNGLVEVQKQEFLKLQKLTKEKQIQQNQQIDIALFNQKKEYAKLYPQKEKLKNEILNSKMPLQFPEKKQPYQFQFTSIKEENPFEFNEKKKILDLEPKNIQDYMVDQSDSKIQEMLKQWEFKSESSYKSDNPDDEIDKFRKKYQNQQDDLKSKNNVKSFNDLSQSLAKSQSQINFQSQSAIQSVQNSVAISKVNSQRWLQQQDKDVQSNISRNQQI